MNLALSGFKIGEQLHQSQSSLVFRAVDTRDGQAVVLKLLRGSQPSAERLARFRFEFEITRLLEGQGAVKTLGFHQESGLWAMVLEDFGASSLERLDLAGHFDIGDFLDLAVKIIEPVIQVHRLGIIHKDLNPANIVYNPKNGRVKLIDFGIATRLSRERIGFRNPGKLEGTPAYMSPEQTGRMNRSLDHRTDLYSLGVTFFELLTGSLPFEAGDLPALLHAQIAKPPPSPRELKENLPEPLCQIILKLMAKDAENRYGSSFSLKEDLLVCRRSWRSNRTIEAFPLEAQKASGRLEISQKLYGREKELAALRQIFGKSRAGRCELVLVAGYSGIGKTSLVKELYQPITADRGYFVSGKFDQLGRNQPLTALIQALKTLVGYILTETEADLAAWRERILAALGSNGQLLAQVLPELSLVTGPLEKAMTGGPGEAPLRFAMVLENFIKVFARPEHPLVIFLDDLQWADNQSLYFFERFFSMRHEGHALCMIGAFRSNEVDATHPLNHCLDRLTHANADINRMELEPLRQAAVVQLLGDSFALPEDEVAELADLVYAKTDGNPFFVIEFLRSLHARDLVTFDLDAGRWRWRSRDILALDISDNVLALMRERLHHVPAPTREVLRLAACLGNRFDLSSLSAIHETSYAQTAAELWPAVKDEVVVPLGDDYRLAFTEGAEPVVSTPCEFKFAHDRIQESAYRSIDESERPAIHLGIGRKLLARLAPDRREAGLVRVVDHLNLGSQLLESGEARQSVAALNYEAGCRVMASASYASAHSYFMKGLALLGLPTGPRSKWEKTASRETGPVRLSKSKGEGPFRLGKSLYEKAAETAYLRSDLPGTEKLAEAFFQQIGEPLDRLAMIETKINAYKVMGKPREAIDLAFEVLRGFGLEIPDAMTPEILAVLNGKIETELAGRQARDLIELPPMEDPKQLGIMRVIHAFYNSLGVTGMEWLPFFAAQQVLISIRHGHTTGSILGYVNYAVLVCGPARDYARGMDFYELALALIEKLNAPQLKPYSIGYPAFVLLPFVKPLQEIGQTLLANYQIGLDTGDFASGANNLFVRCLIDFPAGKPLAELEREMETSAASFEKLKVDIYGNWQKPCRQALQCWLGRTETSWRVKGPIFDEDQFLGDKDQDATTLLFYQCFKVVLCVHMGRYREAFDQLPAYDPINTRVGISFSMINPYRSLILLARHGQAGENERKEIQETVAKAQEELTIWAEHAPMNWKAWWCLVEARRAEVFAGGQGAASLYEQAIDLAQKYRFPNQEALACELAADFFVKRGSPRIAGYHFRDAHYAYQRWGAVVKVRDLEERIPQFLRGDAPELTFDPTRPKKQSFTDTDSQAPQALDLESVLKASQAISGEIVLGRLVEALVAILIEIAGAERGVFLLKSNGGWAVERERSATSSPKPTMARCKLEDYHDLPKSMVNYVLKTGEDLVINNVAREAFIFKDPYLDRAKPRSLLCILIQLQGKPSAMVYLEHRAATGVFTSERLATLRLLASQTAISVENARLYADLERQVDERTHELKHALGQLEQKHGELKETQAQLVHSEKMASLAPLTAGVAHEIRNPNTFVHNGARNLERGLEDFKEILLELVDESQKELRQLFLEKFDKFSGYLVSILDGSRRIEQIIKDLSTFTRHHQGQVKTVRLTEGLVAAISLVKANVQDQTEIECDFRADPEMECRPAQLDQVYMNLILNACQAISMKYVKSGEKGKLIVRTAVENGEAVVRFEDEGCGIPQTIREKIFEPFFTTREVGSGKGLGLSIAYGIVQQHGGRIVVDSIEGEGSTFSVFLPLKPV